MTKTILLTGIGGLTPRSIATVLREKYPDYYLIGVDADQKAMGFFMTTRGRKLVDEYYVCPRCDNPDYFPFIERLVAAKQIDYAFVQPKRKSWNGGIIMTKTVNSRLRFLWDANGFPNHYEISPLWLNCLKVHTLFLRLSK